MPFNPFRVWNDEAYLCFFGWIIEHYLRQIAHACGDSMARQPDKELVRTLAPALRVTTRGGAFTVTTNIHAPSDVQHLFMMLRDTTPSFGKWRDASSMPPVEHAWLLARERQRSVLLQGAFAHDASVVKETVGFVDNPLLCQQLFGWLFRQYGQWVFESCRRGEDAEPPETTRTLPIVLAFEMPGAGMWEFRSNANASSPREFLAMLPGVLRHAKGMGQWYDDDSMRDRIWSLFAEGRYVVYIRGKIMSSGSTTVYQNPKS